ncbi:hypothetical protein [Halomonas elongata]|uniref:Uncharacterized protein n=1 Tax=Halomonas elongata (strain ATCC 33173 / DSM 2581 / NBRC 15536 / NCIMB 2198 / 1H9) TaxID=768066 RepID=E1VAW4_HALED|nr:hypothetical protein [Halomonas elongata]WBF17818.1 hypothetical protein LM502_17400 [Halomonas elongata]WPU46663.1 hypothetical protein SR933_15650 [Halomonas elongata DSM 2581]CBV44063.1 uncharacterized protein HELO_4179 [Halomonas elongata DSM 2581]
MVNHGGRYEIRDGKRVLVHRTKPAPDPKPKAPAPKATKAATKPAPDPKPTQSDNVKEQDDG